MIIVDPPERALDALPTLEGTAQGVPGEACALLEDDISVGGPSSADNVVGEAPSTETTIVSLFSVRQFNLAIGGPRMPRGPDRLVLNSSVKPMK